jgi:8-oxo-dGTP pyrophosphatase MutT (NUDIX family)
MEAQKKVAAFVTRGSGSGTELLVFWHTGSGVQIPAGSVEDGESFDAAAVREVAEETARDDFAMVRGLGTEIVDLPEGKGVLRRPIQLRTRAAEDAPVLKWTLQRVWVSILAREQGFARVLYEESDYDAPAEDRLVYARFEGWVPEDDLLYRSERAFYHFRATGPTPEKWHALENGEEDFHLYWVPLTPKPSLLVPVQQGWLDQFYDDVIASVARLGDGA